MFAFAASVAGFQNSGQWVHCVVCVSRCGNCSWVQRGRGKGVQTRLMSVQQAAQAPRTAPLARVWCRLRVVLERRCHARLNMQRGFRGQGPLEGARNGFMLSWKSASRRCCLVRERESQEMAASAKLGAHSWREWAQSSGAGGAGRAHKWLRRLEQLREDEVGNDHSRPNLVGATSSAQVQLQTHQPASQWPEAGQTGLGMRLTFLCLQPIMFSVLVLVMQEARSWEEMAGHCELGQCCLGPWAFRKFHQRLALTRLVVLLGKPSGGTRPIGLLSGLWPLYATVRLAMVQQWEEEHKLPMHWGGKSKSCDHHGWLQQLMHEAALGVGDVSAGMHLDICRAFEHIGHQCLWRNAQHYSFSKRVLAVACTCIYGGPRCLTWRQQIAIPICVSGTVIPGCDLAVALMKLALHDVLVGALEAQVSAQVQQAQVVDDLSASCSGAPCDVISSLVAMGQHLLHGLARRPPCQQG
eukprot:3982542-Amphidinium_carterae.1